MISGRSVISASTPHASRRAASASLSTVHTCTPSRAACALSTNLRDTTCVPGELRRDPPEKVTGIGPRKLARGPVRDRPGQVRRPLQRPVVVNDDDAIGREVDVKLQTLGAEGQAAVEGRDGILRRERAPASMGEYLRPVSAEDASAKERPRQGKIV